MSMFGRATITLGIDSHSSLLCVCLVHNVDDCMKSVFLPLHVAVATVKLTFCSYVYD